MDIRMVRNAIRNDLYQAFPLAMQIRCIVYFVSYPYERWNSIFYNFIKYCPVPV